MAVPMLLGEDQPTFRSLLAQLEQEHERQLNLLRLESERLLAELRGQKTQRGASDWLNSETRRPARVWLHGSSSEPALNVPPQAVAPVLAAPRAAATAPSPSIGSNDALERRGRTRPPHGAGGLAATPEGAAPPAGIAAPGEKARAASGETDRPGDPADRALEPLNDDLQPTQSRPARALERMQQSLALKERSISRPRFAQRDVWTSDYMENHDLSIQPMLASEPGILLDNGGEVVKGCAIMPNSNAKLVWDITGMVLLIWDMIAIPFSLAFSPEEGWLTKSISWATLIFWTIDIGLAFFTAYFEQGRLITSPKEIVWHYLKTWFLLDCCIVGLDWFMIGASLLGGAGSRGGGSIVGIGRLLRGLRVVRILRLLRLAKLKRLAQKVYDLIDTEYMFLVIKLVRLMVTILFINHVVCCMWFAIGHVGGVEMPHWLDRLTHAPGQPGSSERLTWEYATSLHWSLCQFTPAGMEIVSVNTHERIFSCLIVFFAMGVFTSVVANVSASMTALRSMSDETAKQFWLLRRYMTQNDLSLEARARILRYLEHQAHQESNKVKPPQILSRLSEPLREMLAGSLIEHQMLQHPFFRRLHDDAERVMHQLCYQAFTTSAFAEEDVVFSAGQVGVSMFIPGPNTDNDDLTYKVLRSDPVRIPASQNKVFIAEGVLWTFWRHLGELRAAKPCSLLSVMPAPLAKAVSGNPKSWNMAKSYSEKYVQFLNEEAMDAVLTDVVTEIGNSMIPRI